MDDRQRAWVFGECLSNKAVELPGGLPCEVDVGDQAPALRGSAAEVAGAVALPVLDVCMAKSAKTQSASPELGGVSTPTISIYQNPDHVAGLLQQAHATGLLTEGSTETHQESSASTTRGGGGEGEVGAGFGVPVLADTRAKLSGTYRREAAAEDGSGTKLVTNFAYSQAFYLHYVRRVLRDRDSITVVTSRNEANNLTSGSFVEYRASFRPSEVHALLDIFTPDLVAAITDHQVRQKAVAAADNDVWTNFDRREGFFAQTGARAKMHSDLARSVAEAIRVDFRSTKTREFYGTIGMGDSLVTAVTICDDAHFVVDDEDRILDGDFTVLGKVTGSVTDDLPVFDRNKILRRLRPDALDLIFTELRKLADGQLQGTAFPDSLSTAGDLLDLALDSRIQGPSFKVIPVAIYV